LHTRALRKKRKVKSEKSEVLIEKFFFSSFFVFRSSSFFGLRSSRFERRPSIFVLLSTT